MAVSSNAHLVADLINKTPPPRAVFPHSLGYARPTRGERNTVQGLSPLKVVRLASSELKQWQREWERGMAKPRVLKVVRDVYAVTIGRGALSTNVYMIRSGSSWTLVDAGWLGSDKKIRAAAESVFGPETRPTSMVLTHLHPDHSGATARLAERWGQPAYVHPDELPLAAGYQQAYAIPLDRWLMPMIRRLRKKTQARIAAGSDLTAVVQALDPEAVYRGCSAGRPSTAPVTPPATSACTGARTGC
jgi:hypothetical protein